MTTKLPTIPGMSVHREIERRIAAEREQARSLAFEEAIAVLRMAGFDAAATALDVAAFGPATLPTPLTLEEPTQ